jgi:hypothetical protein
LAALWLEHLPMQALGTHHHVHRVGEHPAASVGRAHAYLPVRPLYVGPP